MLSLDAWRNRIRDGRAARQRRAALKRHDLTVLPLRRDMPEAEDDLAALDRLWETGELERFDALYAAAERRDLMMGNALKLHVVLWTELLARAEGAGDGPALDRLCEPFARWWERSGTPMAGAAYASALLSAAFAHRGGGYADTVSEAQWAAFHARLETGRAALDACATSGAGSLPWAWTHYDYGLHGNDGFEDFQGRFMRACPSTPRTGSSASPTACACCRAGSATTWATSTASPATPRASARTASAPASTR